MRVNMSRFVCIILACISLHCATVQVTAHRLVDRPLTIQKLMVVVADPEPGERTLKELLFTKAAQSFAEYNAKVISSYPLMPSLDSLNDSKKMSNLALQNQVNAILVLSRVKEGNTQRDFYGSCPHEVITRIDRRDYGKFDSFKEFKQKDNWSTDCKGLLDKWRSNCNMKKDKTDCTKAYDQWHESCINLVECRTEKTVPTATYDAHLYGTDPYQEVWQAELESDGDINITTPDQLFQAVSDHLLKSLRGDHFF